MFGLLLKGLVGVVAVAAVCAVGFVIYKTLTHETIKEELQKVTIENDAFKKAFKAKVDEIDRDNQTINIEVFDQWDESLGDISLTGDDISDDIHYGDVIILDD